MRFPLFHPPMITLKKNVKRLIWNLYARAVPHLHESPLFFTFLPIYFVFLSFFFPSFFLFFFKSVFCVCLFFFFFLFSNAVQHGSQLPRAFLRFTDEEHRAFSFSFFFFFYFFFLIFLARHEKSSTQILTRFSIVQISVSLFVYLFFFLHFLTSFFSLSLLPPLTNVSFHIVERYY